MNNDLEALRRQVQGTRRLLAAIGMAVVAAVTMGAMQKVNLLADSFAVRGGGVRLDKDGLAAPQVPLGMMLPFFGQDVPAGFVLADGNATWPMADWVPEHLRGKNVPDMTGRTTVGGDVGKAPAVSSFASSWTGRIGNERGCKSTDCENRSYYPPLDRVPNLGVGQARIEFEIWPAWSGTIRPTGTLEASNLPRVECRFIIRVK